MNPTVSLPHLVHNHPECHGACKRFGLTTLFRRSIVNIWGRCWFLPSPLVFLFVVSCGGFVFFLFLLFVTIPIVGLLPQGGGHPRIHAGKHVQHLAHKLIATASRARGARVIEMWLPWGVPVHKLGEVGVTDAFGDMTPGQLPAYQSLHVVLNGQKAVGVPSCF
jgi:hypothetical protein